MNKCIECAFFKTEDEKTHRNLYETTCICTIEKLRNPGRPEKYLKTPHSTACLSNFKSKYENN